MILSFENIVRFSFAAVPGIRFIFAAVPGIRHDDYRPHWCCTSTLPLLFVVLAFSFLSQDARGQLPPKHRSC